MKAAVPALGDALQDPDTEVRHRAAGALGGIGVEAKAAVLALVGTLLITALLGTAAAFTIQSFAQQVLPPTHTVVLLTLEPVFAWLISLLFLHEILDLHALLGAALILAGIAITELLPAANTTATTSMLSVIVAFRVLDFIRGSSVLPPRICGARRLRPPRLAWKRGSANYSSAATTVSTTAIVRASSPNRWVPLPSCTRSSRTLSSNE